jgi:HSP20 family protein
MKAKSMIPVGQERNPVARENNPIVLLQQEMDRLFNDFGSHFPAFATSIVPRMDIAETDKAIDVTAELPGLEEKDVEINFTDGVLTVRGEKKTQNEQKDKDFRLVERQYGSFSRLVELPKGVDPAAIQASLVKGVLTVTVPKPAASVAKKIEVKAAA